MRFGYGGSGKLVLRAAVLADVNSVNMTRLLNDWLDAHRRAVDVVLQIAAGSDGDSGGIESCGWILLTYYERANDGAVAAAEADADARV